MEQETRKFAIEQAILLIKDNGSVNNKTKAVFDLAEQILKWTQLYEVKCDPFEQTK